MPKRKPLVSKLRRNTAFKVYTPLAPSIDVKPVSVELIQKQYAHDVLLVNYANTYEVLFKHLQTGVPIKFEWIREGQKKVWLGYVSSISRQSGSQTSRPMQLRCVGASFVLKKKKNRVFKNASIPEVAAKIAKENGLRFVGDPHPRKFPQINIVGKSYWEWLHENAKKIGFVMYVEGATMYLRRADKVVDTNSSNAPVLQLWSNAIPKNEFLPDRTLDHFKVHRGEYDESGDTLRTEKSVGGVNPVTGKHFVKKANPKTLGKKVRKEVSDVLFSEHQVGVVASNQIAAGLAAAGAAQLARFNIPADFAGQGDPRIQPFGLVNLDGTGASTDGFWLVKECRHFFTITGEYTVTGILLADGIGQNKASGVRKDSDGVVGKINLEDVIANAVDGRNGTSIAKLSLSKTSSRSDERLFVPGQVVIQQSKATLSSRPGFNRTPARWQPKSGK